MSIAQRQECNSSDWEDFYVHKSKPANKNRWKGKYWLGWNFCRMIWVCQLGLNVRKCLLWIVKHGCAKVPKLSYELLLENDNAVDCEDQSLKENAILHIDKSTVLQESSFDCEVDKIEMNRRQ